LPCDCSVIAVLLQGRLARNFRRLKDISED
jgi:hypothetical protein